MEKNESFIGVIDSGLGGLSVLRYLTVDMPNESFIYFADSAFCPYGKRSFSEIQQRLTEIIEFLQKKYNFKLIVIACNTATAAAIDLLREKYSIPFVGMEPAIKPAALATKTGVVGVLATEGTFNGRLFKQTLEKYASDVEVIIKAGNGLVELIESGKTDGDEIEMLLYEFLQPMAEKEVDLLVLGCTHFPFLSETINRLFPAFKLVDPAPAVSKQAVSVLNQEQLPALSSLQRIQLLTTGDKHTLRNFASRVLRSDFSVDAVTL